MSRPRGSARARGEGIGRRRLLAGLVGMGAAGLGGVGRSESAVPTRAARDDGRERGVLDRLAAGSCGVRGLPRVSFRVHAAFAARKELRLVARARPWPAELEQPVLTVSDPEPWRAAPEPGGAWSAARRAAAVQRVRDVAGALGLRAHVAFGEEDGVYLVPRGREQAGSGDARSGIPGRSRG